MADLLPSLPDTSAAEEADPRVVGLADDDADELLSALSASTAREILAALHEDPAPPSRLAETVDTSLQNAQYHLGNLEEAGLVEVVDTAYSSKGREMDVYAPTDRPLVVVAGDEDDGSSLKAAISRFLGGLGVLSVASLVVETLAGRWSGGDGESGAAPVAVEDEYGAGGGGGDGAESADADEEDGTETEDAEGGDAATEDGADGGDDAATDDDAATNADDEGGDGADEGDDVTVASDQSDAEETEEGGDSADGGENATASDGENGTESGTESDTGSDADAGAGGVNDTDGGDLFVEAGDALGDGGDEALGLPPGFLFFLGGLLSMTVTFASWYWRTYR